jgi:hypothetical protein
VLWLAGQRGQVPEGLVDTPTLLVEDDEQSEVIRGLQRSSEATRGHQRGRQRGRQRPSAYLVEGLKLMREALGLSQLAHALTDVTP